MVGSVHLAVGGALGAICATTVKKAPRNPFSAHGAVELFLLGSAISFLGIVLHFVCDYFPHTEYHQMSLLFWPMIFIDMAVANYLIVYVTNGRLPITPRLCVASAVFWSAFIDGLQRGYGFLHSEYGLNWLSADRAIEFHYVLHTPTPSYGILNQFAITLISLIIMWRLTRRPSP